MLRKLFAQHNKFVKETAVTLGTKISENGKDVYILPGYITEQMKKYCDTNGNPTYDGFCASMPTWFMKNSQENKHKTELHNTDTNKISF